MAGERTSLGPNRVRVVVSQTDGDTWQAQVELLDSPGRPVRVLKGETCRAVTDATIVVLAMAIGGEKQPAPTVVAPAPKPAKPPAARPWAAGVGGAVESGTLPSMGAGIDAWGSWTPSRLLRLEAGAGWLAHRSGVISDRPWEGAEFSLVRVAAQACLSFETGPVTVGPCAGAAYQWLVADGFGSQEPLDAVSQTASLSLGGVGAIRLGAAWRLRLGLLAFVPVQRSTFVIEGAGTVFQPSRVSMHVVVGPEIRF